MTAQRVTYNQLGALIGTAIALVGFVAPTLDRIHRLETANEVLNVKLTAIQSNLTRLTEAYERLASSQDRSRGPWSTP